MKDQYLHNCLNTEIVKKAFLVLTIIWEKCEKDYLSGEISVHINHNLPTSSEYFLPLLHDNLNSHSLVQTQVNEEKKSGFHLDIHLESLLTATWLRQTYFLDMVGNNNPCLERKTSDFSLGIKDQRTITWLFLFLIPHH